MEKSIKLTTSAQRRKSLLVVISLTLVFLFAVSQLNLALPTFFQRFGNAGRILANFWAFNIEDLGDIFAALLTSVLMAFGALILGSILSAALAFLGAHTLAPSSLLSGVIKGSISIIRAIPALVWILIIVASIGFGNTAGIIGLMIPTVGYLTKAFISSIEEQDAAILEALKATGANWFQLIAEGVLPSVALAFLSWIAIRLESNIAESISIGMVGAGGIGALLAKATANYDYPTITTIILIIFITMASFELFITLGKKTIR